MTTDRPRLAAIYSRVSTEEQAKTSGIPSTETQVRELRDLAGALSVPVAPDASGLIVEEVHSGTDLRWQGSLLMELARRAQRGDFTDLLCLNIDRFCRAGSDAFREQLAYFEGAGITVHFKQLPLPEDMPFRSSVQGFIADAAQYWLKGVREASMRERTAYAKAGNFIPGNTPPFGWRFIEDPTKRTRRDKPVKIGLIPDPATAPALLHLYEHVAARGSVGALKRWLEEQGIPTPKDAPVWHPETIRRILHNPTNWGERRSFYTHVVPHEQGVRRPADVKSTTRRKPVPLDKQYEVDPNVIQPIPGLTRDLAMRVLTILKENQFQHALAAGAATETERAERGLLFGGMVRCGTCKGGLRVKKNQYSWIYVCFHTGTKHEGEPCITMSAPKLDPIVWARAVYAVRDPHYFEQLAHATDTVAGPAALAKSLEHQLAEATRDRDLKRKHWLRLDPDDPTDAAVMGGVKAEVARAENHVRELTASLDAMRTAVEEEEARRATLTAFRDFAAGEREQLDSKSPLEKHQLLQALGTRVLLRVRRDADGNPTPTLHISFDIRHLPGAAGHLRPSLTDDTPHTILSVVDDQLVSTTVEVVQTEDAERFGTSPTSAPTPLTAEERAESAAELAHIDRADAAYRAWLKRTRRPDTLANFDLWYTTVYAGDAGDAGHATTPGDTLPGEPRSDGASPTVPVERTYS